MHGTTPLTVRAACPPGGGLDVDQDRAVDVPAAQREVINAEDLRDPGCRVGQGPDQPQQRPSAGSAGQAAGQARPLDFVSSTAYSSGLQVDYRRHR